MRIAVLGGTRFIGRAIVRELARRGHALRVIHRGVHPGAGLPVSVERRVADRSDAGSVRDALRGFRADVLLDTRALTRKDARALLAATARGLRLVVLSSMDVYQAYGSLLAKRVTEPVPIDETGALRSVRYPYRGELPDRHDYDKLDVEEALAARKPVVCRLGAVYGEHDYQRREEFILRRVRARRARIPVGNGGWLWTRAYVGDVARGVALAIERAEPGEVFNFGERRTAPVLVWAEQILRAAGHRAKLVRVPDHALPEDLEITGTPGQPLLFDSAKARDRLGWSETPPERAVARSVRWHLAHPPEDASRDFAADDRALRSARR